jgi:hypothetical protein
MEVLHEGYFSALCDELAGAIVAIWTLAQLFLLSSSGLMTGGVDMNSPESSNEHCLYRNWSHQ